MSKITFDVKKFNFTNSLQQIQNENQTQHNPFSVSFKGNELKADVFEFTAQNTKNNQVSFVQKLAEHSANIKTELAKPFMPVISFAGKIKENINNAKNNVVNTLQKLNSIQINKQTFTSAFNKVKEYHQYLNIDKEVRHLMKQPVQDLKEQFESGITEVTN